MSRSPCRVFFPHTRTWHSRKYYLQSTEVLAQSLGSIPFGGTPVRSAGGAILSTGALTCCALRRLVDQTSQSRVLRGKVEGGGEDFSIGQCTSKDRAEGQLVSVAGILGCACSFFENASRVACESCESMCVEAGDVSLPLSLLSLLTN